MPYVIERVDVWAGTIKDQPGGAAGVLCVLAEAGANLEFLVARRDKKGAGVLFAAPIKGAVQARAAKAAGLSKAESLQSLRVEGPNKAGLGAQITRALAEASINLRGISAAGLHRKSVFYFSFDSKKDAAKARGLLKKLLNGT